MTKHVQTKFFFFQVFGVAWQECGGAARVQPGHDDRLHQELLSALHPSQRVELMQSENTTTVILPKHFPTKHNFTPITFSLSLADK